MEDERTAAEPLPLVVAYRLDEVAGANPAGLTVGGEALARYWGELVEYCVGKIARRQAAAKAIDEAYARGDPRGATSIGQWRYGQKIEIKAAEMVLELLHRIVAPDAPFLCDDRCPHVRAGATAGQVKRFLDSLDARVARCRDLLRDCRHDHPCWEDYRNEIYVFERWRRALVEAGGAGE
jgi:hypothetical protein